MLVDPSKSSTYKLKYRNEFNISYVTEGSGVNGDYIIDNVSVGDEIKVKGLTMGLAKRVLNVPTGIMGIGMFSSKVDVRHVAVIRFEG